MRRFLHPAFLALLVVACNRGELVPGVRDTAFVATMADLRRAEGTTLDSASRAAARRRILQQRGLTAEQLVRAARALARNPPRALTLWQEIERRAVTPEPDSQPPPAVRR